MVNKKETFMFIQKEMILGGIQTYLIRTIKLLKQNNNRIIWIRPTGGKVDEGFESELFDGYVEIINVNFDNMFWINDLNMKIDEDEEIIAYAFSLYNFAFLEMIKNKYKTKKINNFFWVPHFKEKAVFIEEFLNKSLQSLARKYVRKIILSMEENNNIIYVYQSHLETFEKVYNYKVENPEKKVTGTAYREIKPFDEELCIKRSIRETFNIITIGRFSFPHKAYILGLIRKYGKLKDKYNKLSLTIIGYGPDEDKVLDEINKLSNHARRDVNLVGKVEYGTLEKFLSLANLNIGVASTIVDGAITGLISVPVRHYTENCEGYGYLPNSRWCTESSKPGVSIENYIEDVINMSNEEYINLSKKAYDTYSNLDGENEIRKIFSNKNKNINKTLPNSLLYLFGICFSLSKVIKKLKINKIKR